MHCGDLNGNEVQKGGDICTCMADSFCCTVETNTTLQSNYPPIKINLKKEVEIKAKYVYYTTVLFYTHNFLRHCNANFQNGMS